MALLSRKRLLLTKIESSYGTDPSPEGSDAVQVRNLEITPIESETVSRDLIRPYLGNSEQILAQTRVSITFEVELAGSGTAGTASRIDSLLRACGMAATTTAAPVTGSAQAGGAGTITLAAAASSTDDIYNGMVISLTAGTGSGSKGVITAYDGTTKVATVQKSTAAFAPDATSEYSISANVSYKPVSDGFESCTLYFNNSGVLHPATGCRGTFSLTGEASGLPVISFTMTGIYNAPTDTAAPTTVYTNQATPVIFKTDNTVAVSILGFDSACLQSFSFDMANEVIYRELIGCTKSAMITNRQPSGSAVIEAPTLATKNFFETATGNTTGLVVFQHGTTAGNIVSFLAPSVDIGSPSYSDANGIQMLNLPMVFIPSSVGNDEVVLTFQ